MAIAHVVDREAEALLTQGSQDVTEVGVVADRVALGDLHHHIPGFPSTSEAPGPTCGGGARGAGGKRVRPRGRWGRELPPWPRRGGRGRVGWGGRWYPADPTAPRRRRRSARWGSPDADGPR